MTSKDVILDMVAEVEDVDDDEDEDDDDYESKKNDHTKDIHLPCLLDTVSHGNEDTSGLCGDHLFLDDSYYTSSTSLGSDTWNNIEPVPISLIVADPVNSHRLKQVIAPCVIDHELHECTYDDAYEMCSKTAYYMIWLYLGNPASQEILGFTTSIRYATKTNRNTIIVGVTPTKLDVDLGLHGLAEVAVEPITKPYILTKYRKWATSVSLVEKSEKEVSSSLPVVSTMDTSTPSDDINLATNDASSWLPTSDESPRTNMVPPPKSSETKPTPVRSSKPVTFTTTAQKLSRQAMAADHTTKEKLRRERIKDSCDQLRVLLPYIRGRKTDMASILEMTVDYLKLITASLPADFQSQINSLMGKVTSFEEPRPGKTESTRPPTRRNTRRNTNDSNIANPESPSLGKVTSTSEMNNDNCTIPLEGPTTDINGNITTPSNIRVTNLNPKSPLSYTNLKRTDSMEAADIKPAKRMLLSSPSVPSSQSNMLYLSDNDNRKDNLGIDGTHEDPFQSHLQPIHIPQSHMYSDMDRLYSMSSYSQLTGSTNPRLAAIDRDGYGMYMDTYYHYYAGQQSHNSGYGGSNLSDYVNPNAVLPVTYSSRLSDSSRSYEDNDRFSTSGNIDDGYVSLTSVTDQT